ncbi:hypothetical protein AMECASPLE_019218 [Ameca splendens]|uniref:Calponin-homology (CH) domain-containing protein n=1 Tax=Ameca splendens TaxID=208324 RepID=A0ABV0XRV1_9TELE
MNSAEQTVTWLITLGVLESPKKTISDPEAFLQSSLKDGVVLCKLLERLSPGSTDKPSTLYIRLSTQSCRGLIPILQQPLDLRQEAGVHRENLRIHSENMQPACRNTLAGN